MAAILAPQPAAKPRLWFLDNVKVLLTLLVIFHHAGQAYGPGGFWYYKDPQSVPYIGTFFFINASFFMGLFFFISAYFLPGTFERKGAGALLKDRLKRFGIPILLFVLLVNPLIMYVSYIHDRGGSLPFLQYWTQIYFGLGPKPANFQGPSWPDINFGHLWFVEHLLVYALCYAAWRKLWRRPAPATAAPVGAPGDLAILGYVLALLAVTLLVRIPFPIDRWIGLFGFIQMEPAHLPQYLSLFVLGTVAYRRNWAVTMPAKRGMRWFGIGLTGAAAVVAVNVLSRNGALTSDTTRKLIQLAEPFIAVGMLIGMLTLFRERWNSGTSTWRFLADNAFGAYLVHFPLVVLFNYATAGVPGAAIIRFALTAISTAICSLALSHLLRKLPGARAVL